MEKEESKKIRKPKAEVKSQSQEGTGIIAIIRISGIVGLRENISETLDRLRLRRKYACVLIDSKNKNARGMLERVKHSVSYGEIDRETLKELIKNRAKSIKGDRKNTKEEDITEKLIEGKNLEKLGLKPFFRLHPPRKGIKSKLPYPRGVLGNNKKINELIKRML